MRNFLIGLFIVVFWCAFWFMVGIATAHDAIPSRKQPYGWEYDISCCNLMDCRQLDRDEVEETLTGYIWRSKHSGEVHIYTHDERMSDHGSKRIRRSQDEFFHGCESNPLKNPQGQVIQKARKLCLYVPDKAG